MIIPSFSFWSDRSELIRIKEEVQEKKRENSKQVEKEKITKKIEKEKIKKKLKKRKLQKEQI